MWILPADPFLIPNCALFGITAVAFARVLRHFGLGVLASVGIFVATNIVVWPYAKLWIEPWTTTVSSALLWWLLALTADLLACGDSPRPEPVRGRAAIAIGALAAALPLARPTDLLVSAIVMLFVGRELFRGGRLSVRTVLGMAGGALALAVPYFGLHLMIYGFRESDYARAAVLQGFNFADLPWKLAVVVVSPKPWFPDGKSLLEGFPALLPGIAGLVMLAGASPAYARRLLALVALVAIPYCAVFLAYTDLQPPGIWNFANAHYFKWLFPLCVAGCWFLFDALRDRPRRLPAIATLAGLVLATCIRPLPIAVGDDTPARMLLFRGDTAGLWDNGRTTMAWDEAYFRPARIVDAQGEMMNVGRFHQVPDARGERAIAVSRLFASNARRIDPGEAPPFQGPQRPYARYAVRIGFGWPCWMAGHGCGGGPWPQP